MPPRRIGLLGGSFNPAHAGHRHISLLALKRLALDEVWWLVSPQNPLKPVHGMANLPDRMAAAERQADHPRIRVSDIEARLNTRFTVDTIGRLRERFPGHQFVWIMGADNLVQIPRWRRWQRIFEQVPVAVFDRGDIAFRALAGPAASRYRRHRVRQPARLASSRPPAWCFLFTARHPASATEIRAAAGRRRNRNAPNGS
jgi:nicotinate-nucleotide adenylyltransferase